MNISDEKLDSYISNIKNSELGDTEILLNYKKATKRINILKTKYNKISDSNKSKTIPKKKTNSDSDASDEDDIPIEDLVADLDRIKTELESESVDLSSILNLYLEYHRLIEILQLKYAELQNSFHKIDTNKSDIVINKINLDHVLG